MDYVNLSAEVKRLETICTARHHNLKHKNRRIIHQYRAVRTHTEEDIAFIQNDIKNLEDLVKLNAEHSNNFSAEFDTRIDGNYQYQQSINKEVQEELDRLNNRLLDLEETVRLFKRAIGAPGSTDALRRYIDYILQYLESHNGPFSPPTSLASSSSGRNSAHWDAPSPVEEPVPSPQHSSPRYSPTTPPLDRFFSPTGSIDNPIDVDEGTRESPIVID